MPHPNNQIETNPQLVIDAKMEDDIPSWKRILSQHGFKIDNTKTESPNSRGENYMVRQKNKKRKKIPPWSTTLAGYKSKDETNSEVTDDSDGSYYKKYNWPTLKSKHKKIPTSTDSSTQETEYEAPEIANSGSGAIIFTDTDYTTEDSEFSEEETESSYSDKTSYTDDSEDEYITNEDETTSESDNEIDNLHTIHKNGSENQKSDNSQSSSDESTISNYKITITENLEKLRPVKIEKEYIQKTIGTNNHTSMEILQKIPKLTFKLCEDNVKTHLKSFVTVQI